MKRITVQRERSCSCESFPFCEHATNATPAQRYAFAAVYTGPGTLCGIGRADEGESGYTPVPRFGSFKTFNEAANRADELNKELGLSIEQAAKIVCSTMRKGKA